MVQTAIFFLFIRLYSTKAEGNLGRSEYMFNEHCCSISLLPIWYSCCGSSTCCSTYLAVARIPLTVVRYALTDGVG